MLQVVIGEYVMLQLQALMIHFKIIIDMLHTISILTSWEQQLKCRYEALIHI